MHTPTNMSYLTAISRRQLSLPMKFLNSKGLLNGKILDFGCGRGQDADRLKCEAYDITKYDPHYFKELDKSLRYDTITCHYVLNVIEDESKRWTVIKEMIDLLKPNGRIYLSVRRDKFDEGYTSKGTYQCWVKLPTKFVVEERNTSTWYRVHSLHKVSRGYELYEIRRVNGSK